MESSAGGELQWIRQQEVVSDLGQQALETDDLDQLMHDAAVAIANTLDTEYCSVLELLPVGDEGLLREGIGWRDGVVGTTRVTTEQDSQAGYTLRSEDPIIADDLRTEERFFGPELLTNHDIVSSISVIIGPVGNPWGVLGAHTAERREFTDHDATFLQNVANILASAIENERAHSELERYETVVETAGDAIYVVDENQQFTMVNQAAVELSGYSREQLLGAHVADMIGEEEAARANELGKALSTEDREVVSAEFTLSTADGRDIPIEARFASLPTSDESANRVGVARDISDRKERERALSESERRYRTLVEHFPNGAVSLFDDDLSYTAVGGELVDELGMDPDDRIGQSILELYPDDLLAEIEPYFHAALDGEANSFEVKFHDRHLLAYTLPVRDANDEIYAGMLVVQDITERKEMEQQLRESEAKFRMLAENLDEIAWMATPDAEEWVYINPTFEEIWGLERDALYDDPLSFLESVHPDDRERVREGFTRLSEEEFDDEFRIVRPDGEIRWVHARGTRVHDENDEIVRIVGIGEDVTKRKERERDLERALDLLEKTERIADVGGWEIDTDTRDVFWTDHIFELLEVDSDEEPPLDEALDMYYEEDQPIITDAIENAFDSGDPFDVEVRIRTDSGEMRWLRLQGAPEFDDGEVVSLRGAAQDVTERREYEHMLEESNERLEQFAYAASHDLQEPLRMVSSYLNLLERRYADDLDEDAEDFIDFAVDGADRMRDMIEGLLQYSRVESQGDPFEPVDLNAVFADVCQDLQVKIEEANAEVTVEELPRVNGDADQLRQVFQNLLDNAIEYSGDEPPVISVTAEQAGDEWLVTVSDEGIGIDPDDQDRVFEVFQRLHASDGQGGTGIGLALCERIVERHGGDIWVESRPKGGSEFTFTLPPLEENDE